MKIPGIGDLRAASVRGVLAALLASAVGACVEKHNGPSGSDTTTNWLSMCKRNTDCRGQSSCLSGTCSIACSPAVASDCSALATEAECVAGDDAQRRCDLPCRSDASCGGLGADYVCNAGFCRPQDEPTLQEPPAPSFDASTPLPVTDLPAPLLEWMDAGGWPLLGDLPTDEDAGADAALPCPNLTDAAPPVWQPPAWEPYTSDAGREEQFKIVRDTFVGRWHGLATPSWTRPYLVDMEFEADGRYSARCTETDVDPCCLVFMRGSDRDSDLKRYHLLDAQASGYLIGDIDVASFFGDMFQFSEAPGKLSYIERDRSGNGLRFRFSSNDATAPLRFDLRRVVTP